MKKNLIPYIIVVGLAAILLVGGRMYASRATALTGEEVSLNVQTTEASTQSPEASEEPEPINEKTDTKETEEVQPRPTLQPASGYVLVSLSSSGQYGIIPLPEEGTVSYPIRQRWADGSETENVICLDPEGVLMESSTCENQNCVDQGKVTLENKASRILYNCIICAPNSVSIELYSAEEMQEMMNGNE